MGGSLPFRSGVVVSLRPLSACLGSLWLVTAHFPSLSLYLPVPIFSWLHLLLRRVPLVCCLALPMVVRTLTVGPGVSYASCLPFALYRALGLLVPVASQRRFSLPIWVRYTGQFLVGPPTSVCVYLHALSLRVCCQVVLAVSRHFGCP